MWDAFHPLLRAERKSPSWSWRRALHAVLLLPRCFTQKAWPGGLLSKRRSCPGQHCSEACTFETLRQGVNPDHLRLFGPAWATVISSMKWPCCLVAQACPTLCNPMDCSPPGSSTHGILQARILEWVAISFSRGSSRPRDRTWLPALQANFFTVGPPAKPIKWASTY